MSVAVVVATHGDRRWRELAIERALPSVAAQLFSELIFLHDDELSLAEVRNEGARRATASTLVFLDADDELAPDYVDAILSTEAALSARGLVGGELGGGGPCLLVPRVLRVAADGTEGEPEFPNRSAPMEELNHCVIGTAVPRDLFQAVGGFRSDLPIYEDWELFLRLKREGARLVDVPGAVYRAFEGEGGRNLGRDAYATYWRIRAEHEAARP